MSAITTTFICSGNEIQLFSLFGYVLQKNNFINDKFINAYQLDKVKSKSNLEEELKQQAIADINSQIPNIKKPKITQTFNSKTFILSGIIFFSFIALLFNSGFNNASIRLLNPTIKYDIPTPFKINNMTEINEILEGDSLNVVFEVYGGEIGSSLIRASEIHPK